MIRTEKSHVRNPVTEGPIEIPLCSHCFYGFAENNVLDEYPVVNHHSSWTALSLVGLQAWMSKPWGFPSDKWILCDTNHHE